MQLKKLKFGRGDTENGFHKNKKLLFTTMVEQKKTNNQTILILLLPVLYEWD